MPSGLEVRANRCVIEHLAVVHDLKGAIRDLHWLMTTSDVDDAQTPVSQPNTGCDEQSRIVRPPMSDHVAHANQVAAVDNGRRIRRDEAANAAHGRYLVTVRRGRPSASMPSSIRVSAAFESTAHPSGPRRPTAYPTAPPNTSRDAPSPSDRTPNETNSIASPVRLSSRTHAHDASADTP